MPTNPPTSVPSPGPVLTFTGVPLQPSGKYYYQYFADVTGGSSGGYNGGNGIGLTPVSGTITIPAGGNSTALTAGHVYIVELVYF